MSVCELYEGFWDAWEKFSMKKEEGREQQAHKPAFMTILQSKTILQITTLKDANKVLKKPGKNVPRVLH